MPVLCSSSGDFSCEVQRQAGETLERGEFSLLVGKLPNEAIQRLVMNPNRAYPPALKTSSSPHWNDVIQTRVSCLLRKFSCIVLYGMVWDRSFLWCVVLYCIALYCIVLYCIVCIVKCCIAYNNNCYYYSKEPLNTEAMLCATAALTKIKRRSFKTLKWWTF